MLGQNPIPEFDWDNYVVSNEENEVVLRVNYLPEYNTSACTSIFSLNLVTDNFYRFIPNNELTFCGVPYEIDGPFDRNNVYQFSNFQWYHNGNLVSNYFNVSINDIGEWEVFLT